MLCALLAVGFGYVAFAHTAPSGGVIWDLGFLIFSTAFLVSFIWLIWRHAVVQISRRAEQRDEDDP